MRPFYSLYIFRLYVLLIPISSLYFATVRLEILIPFCFNKFDNVESL